jgi:hypothetical protein
MPQPMKQLGRHNQHVFGIDFQHGVTPDSAVCDPSMSASIWGPGTGG